MGQPVVIVDDSRARRVTAALLHASVPVTSWSSSATDLIVVEVEHPRAHGMDPVRTGARS